MFSASLVCLSISVSQPFLYLLCRYNSIFDVRLFKILYRLNEGKHISHGVISSERDQSENQSDVTLRNKTDFSLSRAFLYSFTSYSVRDSFCISTTSQKLGVRVVTDRHQLVSYWLYITIHRSCHTLYTRRQQQLLTVPPWNIGLWHLPKHRHCRMKT